jgi:endonuclease/exonuclease/phosphatase family metal-dependent hydrolase
MVHTLIFFLLACDSSTSTEPETSGHFSVLTYNIHGLPPAITNDDTTRRVEQIAPLLADYDVVGLQEDWMVENHDILVENTDFLTIDAFNEPSTDEKVYGSGLSLLSNFTLLESTHIYYERCNGYTDSASDCFASKGIQSTVLNIGGHQFTILNTHLEAGNGDVDDGIRIEQIETIVSLLEVTVGPVILLGDFNLHPDDDADLAVLQSLENQNMRQTCWEVDCSNPNHIDQVWIRSTENIDLDIDNWNAPAHFVDDQGVDLSDHPPIVVNICWTLRQD